MDYLYIKNMDFKILEPATCTCGGDPRIHYCDADTKRFYSIACPNCECRTDDYLKLEDAMRAWNEQNEQNA